MKKLMYVLMLIVSLALVAGCGKKNIMDMYSFGSQNFTLANSTITLELPFGMQPIKNLPGGEKINNGSSTEVSYMGGDNNITVIAVGQKGTEAIPLPDVEQVATNAINRTKASPNVSALEFQVDPTTIGNIKGVKLHLSYVERGNKQSVNQYIFKEKDVLWNVIYLYHTGDQVSEDLAKYLDGKIKINQ